MTQESNLCPWKFEIHPFQYCLWHLEHSYPVYQMFRDLADQWTEETPRTPISSDALCHVIRFQHRLRTAQDAYHISNNLVSFFGRVYKLERPDANVGTRSSWLDTCSDDEWNEVREILRTCKERHENQN